MSGLSRYFPWAVVGVGAVYVMLSAITPSDPPGTMRLREFAALPLADGGRVKPADTLARNSLFIISHRQSFTDDKKDSHPAVEWLLDVMTASPWFHEDGKTDSFPAEKLKVFRIENDQVLNLFGLEERPQFWRYSFDELRPKFDEFLQRVKQAQNRSSRERDLTDGKLLELYQNLQLYRTLQMIQTPEFELQQRQAEAERLPRLETPLPVPPDAEGGDWTTLGAALFAMRAEGRDSPSAKAFAKLLLSYAGGKPTAFNKALDEYKEVVAKVVPASERNTAEFETFFNHFAPFDLCSILYVVVFLLAAFSWLGWGGPLNRAAFGLGVLTAVVHTGALLSRMYIQGRPPITNLYSTAVFIGWGCALTGLGLERIYRNGLGNAVAALCGALSLRLAGTFAEGKPDTLEMMQAVLDTNLWLATHVTSVNVGYMATFVAGAIGCLFIARGVLTEINRQLPPAPAPRGGELHTPNPLRTLLDRATLTPEAVKTMGQMLYGVVCFATLFSFTGTVLGGIWGDQSWGRFWGWDPKENGALMIVIWNALILHARWAGMVKVRGMAVLAAVGNLITAWSYLGTNQLGVGLHAYGFSKTLATLLVVFWGLHVPVLIAGVLPLGAWKGYTPARAAEPAPASPEPRKGRGKASVAVTTK